MSESRYCEPEDVAIHLQETGLIDGGDREILITRLVEVASRLIDNWKGVPDGTYKADTDTVRYFSGDPNDSLILAIGYLADAPTQLDVSESGLSTEYVTWAATDYILTPVNALVTGQPYRYLELDQINGTRAWWPTYMKAIKLTGKFGWSKVPPAVIQEAAMIQTARWFKRGQQAFQDAGAITDLMSLRYLKKLDPDVELLLDRMPGVITI